MIPSLVLFFWKCSRGRQAKSKAKAGITAGVTGPGGRCLVIEELGQWRGDECLQCTESEKLFLDEEAKDLGSVTLASFLRGGWTREPEKGEYVSASGKKANKKQQKNLEQSLKAPTVDKVFEMAEVLGVPMKFHKLDAVPEEELTKVKHGRPPGYQARTRLLFGDMQVPVLLDTCASCSVIPEEVALAIMSHAMKCNEDGSLEVTEDR